MKKLFIGLCFIFILISVASAQNIILNSSFEFWLDSLGVRMPFGWYTSESQDSGTAVRVLDPHSGIYALQLNGSDTSAYAITASIGFAGRNYYFSGWCKSSSIIAGSFIITWLNLSQGIVGNPVIIPIYRSTNWQRYTQMLQCPDSAIIVNLNIVTLPYLSLTVDDVTLTDTVLTGIAEVPFQITNNSIKIFPNPCDEHIRIYSDNQVFNITLFDITGKTISINPEKTNQGFKLNTKQLAEGLYFIKLTIQDKTCIHKTIVRH